MPACRQRFPSCGAFAQRESESRLAVTLHEAEELGLHEEKIPRRGKGARTPGSPPIGTKNARRRRQGKAGGSKGGRAYRRKQTQVVKAFKEAISGTGTSRGKSWASGYRRKRVAAGSFEVKLLRMQKEVGKNVGSHEDIVKTGMIHSAGISPQKFL